MLVDIQLIQGADVNLKLALLGQCIGHGVIQGVNPFDYQNIFFSKLQKVAFVFPFSLSEIESGNFYPFSGQQRRHIPVKSFQINAVQIFKVIIAVFIPGRKFPVYEIIVHRYGMGL